MPTSKDLNDLESQAKVSKISAANFKKQGSIDPKSIVNIHKNISSIAGHVRKTIIRVNTLEKLFQDQSKKITSLKNISKLQGPQIRGTNIGEKLKSLKPGSDDITEIKGLLDQIIEKLTLQNKDQKKATERSRKESETARRSLAEAALEKGFKVAIQTAEKVIAPVKSLLRRIIDFFMTIFWGKVFLKLLDWFADPANKKKIDSLFRFFGDHWPKLLALYLRFGTGFGKAVGKLTNLVFFGTRKLLQVVASMIGAKAAARFLGGRGGRAVQAGLQVATTVGTTMALSGGIESFVGSNKEEKPKTPTFNGGGLANLKRLFGYLGGGSAPGFVSGEKGVDKIPAMLSDGEFVMSRGAVQKYGVSTLESMNASGGGTNKPRMISGRTYAAGGGLIGALGRFLPGTGTVMAPGGKGGDIGYQNKLLGINVGSNISIPISQTYNQKDVDRYNQMRAASGQRDRLVTDMFGRHFSYTPPLSSPQQKPTTPNTSSGSRGPITSANNQRLTIAIQNAKQVGQMTGTSGLMNTTSATAIKAQQRYDVLRDAMRQTGMSGANENMNLYGKPIKKYKGGMVGNYSFNINAKQPQILNTKETQYVQGGMVSRPLQLSKAPARINKITPLYPSVQVATMTDSTGALPSVTGTPGTPNVPSFSATHRDGHSRRLQIAGIA
jgi:hypothetical protein